MSLPLIIVNPASADGATGDTWPGIAGEVRRHFGPFNVAFTETGGDAARIARREAEAGRAFVIACGGDGTINEAANGVLESGADCEFGILPSGTGGDFRRTLRIPARASDAALALSRAATRRMDVGRVTYAGRDGAVAARYFLNVASFGMGGEVIKRVKDNRWLPRGGARLLGGKASFAAAALGAALEYENPSVVVRLDDNPERRLVVTNFCVANARYFGGGMKIAPEAKIDDGLLDVVCIGDMDRLAVLWNSYRVYLGTHLGLRDVHQTRAKKISARSDAPEEVELEV
ncbi:MAG TPA: diacylglycerol kinase family protein, partial [Pyrinomonadaceae bacterium]